MLNNSNMLYNYMSWLVTRYRLLPFWALILCVWSCSKDKQLDADILSVNSSGNSVSYMERGDMVWLNGNSYNFTNVHIAVAINLEKETKSADTVIATVDPSLVAVYNASHLENNPAFADGAFTTTHQGVFPIAANASVATDSLYVQLNDGVTLKHKTVYLVPVRLTTKKGGKLKFSIFYFKMLVTVGNLDVRLKGSTIVNGSSASIIVGGGPFNMVILNAFPSTLKFNVALNSKFPAHETEVEAMFLTNAQLDSVNLARRFGSIPFPDDTYSFSKSVIKVGTTAAISTDSITVSFRNRANFKSFQYYLMGLRLKHYKGSEYGVPPVANDSSIVYVRFFLF